MDGFQGILRRFCARPDSDAVLREYTKMRESLIKKGCAYYNNVRTEFNENGSPFNTWCHPIPKSMSSFKKLKNQGGHAMQREFLYIKNNSNK